MKTYHKIQTVFKRDPATKHKNLLLGEYSLPEFEYLKDNKWVFTEKVDGTNIRVMWDGDKISYNGKTDNAQLHCDLVTRLHDIFDNKVDLFRKLFENPTDNPTEVCLYGEGYGAGIQKGGGNYQEHKDFVLFDIKISTWYLQRENIEEISKTLGIDIVPVIGGGTLNDMIEMTKPGFNSRWGDFIAEGIVARPATELKLRDGKRVITKLKYRDFV